MSHIVHDIGVAKQIGLYGDAIEAGPNLRWLITSGTPGFVDATKVSTEIVGQSEHAWENVLRVLSKAGMSVDDIVKVTQYLTRAESERNDASVNFPSVGLLLIKPLWPRLSPLLQVGSDKAGAFRTLSASEGSVLLRLHRHTSRFV